MARPVVSELWSPLAAVTSRHGGEAGGCIVSSALSASLLPEAPRVLVQVWKTNRTRELILASGVLAVHLLPAEPTAAREASLHLVEVLGMRSGYADPDKLDAVEWRPGETGTPLLSGTLGHVEARVVHAFDADELTVFVADVVAGTEAGSERPLTLNDVEQGLPEDVLARWRQMRDRQREQIRRERGL